MMRSRTLLPLVCIFLIFGAGCNVVRKFKASREVDNIDALRKRISGESKPAALADLRLIVQHAGSPQRFVRAHVANVLGDLAEPDPGRFSEVTMPVLIELNRDGEALVRRCAAKSLVKYRRLAKDATAGLVENIKRYPDADVAWYSAQALGKIGEGDAEIIQTLTTALGHVGHTPYEYELCKDAATALGDIGPPAAVALPTLRKQRDAISERSCRDAIDTAITKIEHGD